MYELFKADKNTRLQKQECLEVHREVLKRLGDQPTKKEIRWVGLRVRSHQCHTYRTAACRPMYLHRIYGVLKSIDERDEFKDAVKEVTG